MDLAEIMQYCDSNIAYVCVVCVAERDSSTWQCQPQERIDDDDEPMDEQKGPIWVWG